MNQFIPVMLMLIIFISSSWMMSKLFACMYALVTFLVTWPIIKLVEGMLNFVSVKYERWIAAGCVVVVKFFGYYMACIWPAYIITWIIIPNSPGVPWWMYAIAFGGFITSKCLDTITISVFALFCYKPHLIESIYSWIPFKKMFMYYPW